MFAYVILASFFLVVETTIGAQPGDVGGTVSAAQKLNDGTSVAGDSAVSTIVSTDERILRVFVALIVLFTLVMGLIFELRTVVRRSRRFVRDTSPMRMRRCST
jgi:hypothetical protein